MLEFLDEGHKVKVTLQFRGREMAHPELGSKILDAVIEQLGPIAKVDTSARLEGRNMTMVLSPDKKAAKRPVSPKPATTKPISANPTPIKQDNSIMTTETEPQNAKDENIQDSQEAI
jgi:translation initiation factor IF-3